MANRCDSLFLYERDIFASKIAKVSLNAISFSLAFTAGNIWNYLAINDLFTKLKISLFKSNHVEAI